MIEGPVFFEPAPPTERLGREELQEIASALGALANTYLRERYGDTPRCAPVVMVTCGTLNALESSHLQTEELAALLALNAIGLRLGLCEVVDASNEAQH